MKSFFQIKGSSPTIRKHIAAAGAKRPLSSMLALASALIALGVLLSPITIPFGPMKLYPFAHTVNVLAGIFLGPWYATLVATAVGITRMAIGTGTIFALPGGVPGALVIGLIYRYVWKNDLSSFTGILGSPIGAFIASYIVAPYAGQTVIFTVTAPLWSASSFVGSLVGFLLIKGLRRTRFVPP